MVGLFRCPAWIGGVGVVRIFDRWQPHANRAPQSVKAPRPRPSSKPRRPLGDPGRHTLIRTPRPIQKRGSTRRDRRGRRHAVVRTVLAVVGFGFLHAPDTVVGQEVDSVTVRGGPQCPHCRLILDSLADLGDIEGPGAVNEQAHLWRDALGRFIVWAPVNDGVLQVFDENGDYVRSFGRGGQGPGEYVRPRLLAEAGDIFFIFDTPQLRLTRVGQDFQVLETAVLPTFVGSVIRLEDGSFVSASVDAMGLTPSSFGQPLYHISADGTELLRSFGSVIRTVPLGEASRLRRTLATSRRQGFWAAHVRRYRIERWDPDAGLLSVIERNVPWFEPYAKSQGSATEVRPNPSLRALQEDEDGLLWVLVSVPDGDWRPMPPARVEGGMEFISSAQRNDLHDTVVEVLDVEKGALVASLRVDAHLFGFFPGPGVVYAYAEDEAGHPRYRIFRLHLTSVPQGEE